MGILTDAFHGRIRPEDLAKQSSRPCSDCGGPMTVAEERDGVCTTCWERFLERSRANERAAYLRSFPEAAGVEVRYADCSLATWRGGVPPEVSSWLSGVLDGSANRNLVLFGPNGSGKTHLAVALLRACYEHEAFSRRRLAFVPIPILVERITAEWGKQDRPYSEWITKAWLAVIDDLSRAPGENRMADEAVWSLIYQRHAGCLPMIVTTNRDPVVQHKLDTPTWSRILDGAIVKKLDPGVDRRIVPHDNRARARNTGGR